MNGDENENENENEGSEWIFVKQGLCRCWS